MRSQVMRQFRLRCEALLALRTLVNFSSGNGDRPTADSVLPIVKQPMPRQLIGRPKPTPTPARVRSRVPMLVEVPSQFAGRLELRRTVAAVEQLRRHDVRRLDRLQTPRRRLYVSIEMGGECRLHREPLVADSALVRKFLSDGDGPRTAGFSRRDSPR